MTNAMHSKDDHWRSRPNGATSMFDPGLSPPGTDAEAGGVSDALDDAGAGQARPPLRTSQVQGGPGLLIPPWTWYVGAGLLILVLLVAGVASL